MPLVHLVDLSIVCGAIAIAYVFHEQASELVNRGTLFQSLAPWALLPAHARGAIWTRFGVLLLQLLSHLANLI